MDFRYNISPSLNALLVHIDRLKNNVLLTQVNPQVESILRWEAKISRVYWSQDPNRNPYTKEKIESLVTRTKSNKLSNKEMSILGYFESLNYISGNWSISERKITLETIETVYKLATNSDKSVFKAGRKDTAKLLEYLDQGKDHPLLQAAISQISLELIQPFSSNNQTLSRLVPYIYLYKHGYDNKNLLNLEEYFAKDRVSYEKAAKNALESNNFASWLDYFLSGVATQTKKVLDNLTDNRFSYRTPKTLWLNDRQQEILKLLDNPKVKIGNASVQKLFKVSQITASRDLNKLAKLNLVIASGKGRSTYYIKA